MALPGVPAYAAGTDFVGPNITSWTVSAVREGDVLLVTRQENVEGRKARVVTIPVAAEAVVDVAVENGYDVYSFNVGVTAIVAAATGFARIGVPHS